MVLNVSKFCEINKKLIKKIYIRNLIIFLFLIFEKILYFDKFLNILIKILLQIYKSRIIT